MKVDPARERRQAAYYLGRVHRFMRRRDWKYRFHDLRKGTDVCLLAGSTKHSLAGASFPGAKYIVLDPRRDIIPTLVHEVLHAVLPETSEKTIRGLEQLVMKHLTLQQAVKLLRRLAAKLR